MTPKYSVGALVGALILCCVIVEQAGATTYNVNIDVGLTNVRGTITTDGTTGTLTQANIMSYDLFLHAEPTSFGLPNIASSLSSALSATDAGLFWQFGADGQFLDFFDTSIAAFSLNNQHFGNCATGGNFCTEYKSPRPGPTPALASSNQDWFSSQQ